MEKIILHNQLKFTKTDWELIFTAREYITKNVTSEFGQVIEKSFNEILMKILWRVENE